MITSNKSKYGLLGRLPFLGAYIRKRIDLVFLKELQGIEQRLTSPMVRFDTLVNDLYDALKDLEKPLGVDPNLFHGYQLVVHSHSSNSVTSYLQRIFDNEFLNIDTFFTLYADPKTVQFLDWYSNAKSIELYVEQMTSLLSILCAKQKQEKGEALIVMASNPALDRMATSRWMRLLVKDLIQLLVVVLTQRTGG